MKHALLLNPFSHTQESIQQDSLPKGSRRLHRSTPVCSNCSSDDIVAHAIVQWSNESQAWELANTFDRPTHCNVCNGPCGITWRPLN